MGIAINSVEPGWIPVERHEDSPEEDKQSYLNTAPMAR